MSDIIIEESVFGQLSDGQQVKRFLVRNKNDFSFSVISYGAAIQSINVKDKNNKLVNVALGFETIEEYSNSSLNPYFGCTVGRVANRISNAEFKINGEVYKLEKNNGNHCLHGGSEGMAWKNWTSAIIENGVKFTYLSLDGEGGFPGEACFEATYSMNKNENKITIEYRALVEKATPINLTNHTYFNLAGIGNKIYDHSLQLNCDNYLDFNPNDVTVTGKINKVDDSKYDFRNLTKLGDRIKKMGSWPEEGFDNYFILTENSGDNRKLGSVKNPENGIQLDIFTNQNGVQLYTGNFLNIKKSDGKDYSIHEGFCLEPHNYPDSLNQSSFPSCILNGDEEYLEKIVFSFSNL